jgi:hypothetical protein
VWERRGVARIATLDRDFMVYRTRHGRRLTNLVARK